MFAMRRIGLKPENSKYPWLMDETKAKWSILTELGRIDEDCPELFDDALSWVTSKKPKVKEAVSMLRGFRTGKFPAPSTLRLLDDLLRTVNRYVARHPDTTRTQIEKALEGLLDAVRDEKT
jgi:hypothetical protein